MKEIIIYRYLTGQTTEEEEKELLVWLKASAGNRQLFAEIKAVWHAKELQRQAPDQSSRRESLARLHRRMDAYPSSRRIAFRERLGRPAFYRWAGVVALLCLLTGIGYRFIPGNQTQHASSEEWVRVTTGSEEKVTVLTLPDHSQVWLDKETVLSYPAHFNGRERSVEVDGTAFFEVKKEARRPFIVTAGSCKVKVLGTAFHVNTRGDDNRAETILLKGSVQLLDAQDQPVALLRPGQQALYSADSGSAEIREVAAHELTSWRFELVTLSNQPIDSLIEALEATYRIRIEMDITRLHNRRYNFVFKRSDDPAAVVHQLSYITGVPVRMIR